MKQDWQLRVGGFDPKKMNHEETIFSIGNGYLCTRGSFAERYPGQNVATFLHGVYDDMPVSFTELANIPNWTSLQITIDGEPFTLETGELLDMERTLDMKTGLLQRVVRWRSPRGQISQLKFERFASMADEHGLFQRITILPENYSATVVVVAAMDGQSHNLGLVHWDFVDQQVNDSAIMLHVRTKKSLIDLGMAMTMHSNNSTALTSWNLENHPAIVVSCEAKQGEMSVIEKRVSLYTSRDVRLPERKALEHLTEMRPKDWDAHFEANTKVWNTLWGDSDIVIEGDDEAQLMARFSIYQMLIAAPRHDDQVSIGAKTLTGYGYRGHVFWDTEIFMLPFFTFVQPAIARNLLMYRYHRLDGARKKAREGGYEGAQYPWESAGTGEEVTPTWVPNPNDRKNLIRIWTGDIQIHITADIAYAVMQYWKATGDDQFMLDYGLEMILEGARFWNSRYEWNESGQYYEINDVIGPDENHDHVDNNAFTNYMSVWHIKTAISLAGWVKERSPETWGSLSAKTHIDEQTLASWQAKIALMYQPRVNTDLVIEQFEGFFDQKYIDLKEYAGRTQSIQEIFGIEEASKIQVLKQADIVMLMYLFRTSFTKEVIEANYDYYCARTDHEFGSSLGPAMHALVANWIGRPAEAYEHFLRAAKADLYDVRGNVGDGIHAASIGGIWQVIVFGFAGLSFDDAGWKTNPHLPAGWKRLMFHFYYQGEKHQVELFNSD